MKNLKPHPLAARLPEMSPAEYAAHKETIRVAEKLIDPIMLLDGMILDGRHRYRACLELGIEPRFENFDPKKHGNPIDYVIAKNSHRNMSEGQKVWAAVLFMDDLAKSRTIGRPKNESKSGLLNGKSSEITALRFGVSKSNVEYGRQLKDNAPSLFARLGTDRAYNVNRAMQELRRDKRQREQRRIVKHATVSLSAAKLVLGDCIEKLAEIPAKSVKVIFTDPPYNIGKNYHGDPHGDDMAEEQFLDWCSRWLAECKRVLTPDGSLFVMINGQYAARVEMILRGMEMHRRNTIYWWENNPENQTGNFSDAVRPIHYFVKHADLFVFHDDVRIPSRRNEIADKRALAEGKLPDNVWIDGRIPGNSLDRVPFKDAPPQLPIAIPETCIRVASDPGDTVLDPFNGNGTTGIAALMHGRRYIGIERSTKYLRQAEEWIKSRLAKLQAEGEVK